MSVALGEVCEINPPKPPADALTPDAPVTFIPMPAVDADSGTVANPEIRPFANIRNGHSAFSDGDFRPWLAICLRKLPRVNRSVASTRRHNST
jgi:hypothetical protein